MAKPWSDGRIKPEKIAEFPRRHAYLTSTTTTRGYGNRVPTSRMAYLDHRWYRIYCAFISEEKTLFIEKEGKRHLLDHPDL